MNQSFKPSASNYGDDNLGFTKDKEKQHVILSKTHGSFTYTLDTTISDDCLYISQYITLSGKPCSTEANIKPYKAT